MPHKKGHSAFDISNMFPKDNKDFGFNIKSSFVEGPTNKQKINAYRRKKFGAARYIALGSGSTEPFTPSEILNDEIGRNVFGQYRT